MCPHVIDHHTERIFTKNCIRIENKEIIPFCFAHCDVIRSAETYILREVIELYFGKITTHHFLATISRGIINYHYLTAQPASRKRAADTLKCTAEKLADIVVDDNNGNVQVVAS